MAKSVLKLTISLLLGALALLSKEQGVTSLLVCLMIPVHDIIDSAQNQHSQSKTRPPKSAYDAVITLWVRLTLHVPRGVDFLWAYL